MDFKQQYQNEMQHITPSEEQSERIHARVYEEIRKPREVQKRKKPLPLKAIAIAGASAACLVLAATFALHFTLGNKALDNTVAGEALDHIYGNEIQNTDAAAREPAEWNEGAVGGMDATADYVGSAPEKSLQAESISCANGTALLRIELNEELSECVVYNGDEIKTYALSNKAELTDDERLLTEIPKDRSSLGEPLFIYIEGSKIWVYDQNKDFLGAFVETA